MIETKNRVPDCRKKEIICRRDTVPLWGGTGRVVVEESLRDGLLGHPYSRVSPLPSGMVVVNVWSSPSSQTRPHVGWPIP